MDCNFTLCKRYLNGNCIKQVGEKCQLEVAKEIIKEFIAWFTDQTESNNWKPVVEKAEQFINDNKIICEKNTGKFFGTVS